MNQMNKSTIRIGIVGAGANTRKMHLPGFQSLPGVTVTRVCNRSKESSEKVAREFDIPAICGHWREVVEADDVDAVLIGTWPYLHAEVSIACLEAGKHVLTEARMARDLGEAKRMLEAHHSHPELVAQIVPAPMSLGVDPTVASLLADEALGEIREICATHTAGQFFREDTPLTWRQDKDLSGTNILSMGIYHEMVQRWLGNDPEWVVADAAVFTRQRRDDERKPRPVGVPDSVTVLGRMGGARLVYHFSGVEPASPRNEIRLNGSKGSLRFDVASGILHLFDGQSEKPLTIPPEKQAGWRVEADFIDSIRLGKPVRLTSFADGVRYMRFTEAVHRSLSSQSASARLKDLDWSLIQQFNR